MASQKSINKKLPMSGFDKHDSSNFMVLNTFSDYTVYMKDNSSIHLGNSAIVKLYQITKLRYSVLDGSDSDL